MPLKNPTDQMISLRKNSSKKINSEFDDDPRCYLWGVFHSRAIAQEQWLFGKKNKGFFDAS